MSKLTRLWPLFLSCGLILGACRPGANSGAEDTDPNAKPLISKTPPAEGTKKATGTDKPGAGAGPCQDLTDTWYECIFEENPSPIQLPGSPVLGAREPLATLQLFWSVFCPECSILIAGMFPDMLAKHPADLQLQLAALPSFAHPVDLEVMQTAYEIRSQKGDEAFWQFLQAVHGKPESLYILERKLSGDTRAAALKTFEQRCNEPQLKMLVNLFRLCEKPGTDCKGFETCVQEYYAAINEGRSVPNAKTETPTCAEITAKRFDCIMKDYVFDIPVDGSPQLGSADAPATVVVFTDFECPYCGMLAQDLTKLHRKLGAKLRVVYKHYPLGYHKDGQLASRLGVAIFEKKGSAEFFKYHDTVFENQDKLSRDWLVALAEKHGLKAVEAATVVDSRDRVTAIDHDRMLGDLLRVTGTPSAFLNGVHLKTGVKIDQLEKILLAEVDRVEKTFPKNDRKNLYARIAQTGRANLRELAKASGVDQKRLDAALKAQTHKKTIEDERALGARHCTEMPCFFINGKRVQTDPRPLLPRFLDEARFAMEAGVARGSLLSHLSGLKNLIQTVTTDAALHDTEVFDFTQACAKPTDAWTNLMPALLACSGASKNCAQFRRCVLQKTPK
jgi:predicted DsbA family dithiol-disulfide isomerase